MTKTRTRYTAAFKHAFFLEYKPKIRGSGFKALAKRFKIPGGHTKISRWYAKWNKTQESLETTKGGDTRSILTTKEKKKQIFDFIRKRNKAGQQVDYKKVTAHVRKATGKNISYSAIKAIGQQEFNIKWKRAKRIMYHDGKKNKINSVNKKS